MQKIEGKEFSFVESWDT